MSITGTNVPNSGLLWRTISRPMVCGSMPLEFIPRDRMPLSGYIVPMLVTRNIMIRNQHHYPNTGFFKIIDLNEYLCKLETLVKHTGLLINFVKCAFAP